MGGSSGRLNPEEGGISIFTLVDPPNLCSWPTDTGLLVYLCAFLVPLLPLRAHLSQRIASEAYLKRLYYFPFCFGAPSFGFPLTRSRSIQKQFHGDRNAKQLLHAWQPFLLELV
jgi:hypothetical protein